jgi:putative sterol carrier protein
MAIFPKEEWIVALQEKLNTDERYGQIAKNWEGDMLFTIEPDQFLEEKRIVYLDLWHGKCRQAFFLPPDTTRSTTISLKAPYSNFLLVLKGDIDPMQALLTRKLGVQGNLALLMRNVPTVLDFVRCCREVTTGNL